MIKIKSSTAKSPEAYIRQIETEIPLVTEADYGKRLTLILLKPEKDEPGSAETLDPEKQVGYKNPNPFHGCSLMPVYNVEDDIIQILRVCSGYYPGSLRSELDRFYHLCDLSMACYYYLPFTISSGEHWYNSNPGEPESGEVPLFRISISRWFWYGKEIAAREECESRFLEKYSVGDLVRAANDQERGKELNNGLKPGNIAGYIRRAFSFPWIAKKISRVA